MPMFDHPHGKHFSLYLIRIFHVPACACCLFSYCCAALRRVCLCHLYTLPIRQLWITIRSPTSLLFSRLKRPSSLSLSLYVVFSSPLIITGFAPVSPSLSCREYPKVDTALQIQSYKDQIEKKDPSPGDWPLLLQGHTVDSVRSAPGLPSGFLHSCFPDTWPRGPYSCMGL